MKAAARRNDAEAVKMVSGFVFRDFGCEQRRLAAVSRWHIVAVADQLRWHSTTTTTATTTTTTITTTTTTSNDNNNDNNTALPSTTFRSVGPSMTHSNEPLLWLSYFRNFCHRHVR